MKGFIGLVCVGLLALGGCGQGKNSQYLGKWVSVKNPERRVEIVENGESYLVKITNPRRGGKSETDGYPAIVKNDMLTFSLGLGEVNLTVDEKTGHLTGVGEEFERQE